MKLGISTFGCDHGRSGIGRYLHRHLVEFQRMGLRPTMHCSATDLGLVPEPFPRRVVSPAWDRPLANLVLHQSWLPWQSRALDVLFLPAANRRLPWVSACPTVGTVHDLAVARLEGKYDAARTFYVSRVLPRLVERLDHVVTVSQASRRDILELTGVDPERVSVIPLGVDHDCYHPQPATLDLAPYGVTGPFLLYVSRIEHPGKNHQLLLRAFDTLKRATGLPHQLVLVGSDWKGARHVHEFASGLRSRNDIVFTGFFPEQHLPQLYNQAEVMVFPSLYEGFGLPVLEAMACGLPVVSSNRASLPEVVGKAGLLFDPDDEEALVALLTRLLGSASLREHYSRLGREWSQNFHWRRTATSTLEILQAVALGAKPNRIDSERSIA